jgi:hypothetical protein
MGRTIFSGGIITNYEGKIILRCSHMVSQHNLAGYVTSKNCVYDNKETDLYTYWYLSLYLDFMTDKQLTFNE